MIKTRTNLPDKLSDLIVVAVRDMRAARKDPRYRLYGWTWHEPERRDDKCEICMAGAVIRGSLQCIGKRDMDLKPSSFLDNTVQRKLLALDHVRQGCFELGFCELLETDPSPAQLQACAVAYCAMKGENDRYCRQGFYSDAAYLRAAKILRKAGL